MTTRAHLWKRQTEEITLPSGREATVQDVDVLSVIMEGGNIPSGLSQFVSDIMSRGSAGQAIAENPDNMQAFGPLLNMVVKASLVSPKVADEPDADADEISIQDVLFQDKMHLFERAMGGADAVERAAAFSEKQGNGAVARPNGKKVRRPAK